MGVKVQWCRKGIYYKYSVLVITESVSGTFARRKRM